MVLHNHAFGSWTNDSIQSDRNHNWSNVRQHVNIAVDEQQGLLRALADLRDALSKNKSCLDRAAGFHEKNHDDPELTGVAEIQDDELLSISEKLALVSLIHGEWADDVDSALDVLRIMSDASSQWPDLGRELVNELKRHSTSLHFVEHTFLDWSHMAGKEYDRRHSDLLELPFDTFDLGPTNSAHLPPVL